MQNIMVDLINPRQLFIVFALHVLWDWSAPRPRDKWAINDWPVQHLASPFMGWSLRLGSDNDPRSPGQSDFTSTASINALFMC